MKFGVSCFIKTTNMPDKNLKHLGKLGLSQAFTYELNACLNDEK